MRSTWCTAALAVVVLVCTVAAVPAAARETITVPRGRTVEDVVVFGKDVRIYGTVEGSIVTICGSVTIEDAAEVYNSVVAVLGRITAGSGVEIDGDTVAVLGSVTVGEDAQVDGDAVAVLGSVVLGEGTELDGDTVAILGSIMAGRDAQVDGDAVAILGNITVGGGAEIDGDAVTVLGSVDVDTNGLVRGTLVDAVPGGPRVQAGGPAGVPGWLWLFLVGPFIAVFGMYGLVFSFSFSILKAFFAIAIAVIVTSLFPEQVGRMATCIRGRWPRTALVGAVTLMLIPLLVAGFAITLIGIPLIPVLLLAVVLLYFYGTVAVAIMVGRLFPNAEARSHLRNAIIGVLVLALLKLVPGVGALTAIAVVLLAFGSVMYCRYGTA